MAQLQVRVRLATTHPVPVYGGMQLPREVMVDLAAAVKAGALPMHFNHDVRRLVAAQVVDAGVEDLPDGESAAWAEFLVDEQTWSDWQEEVKEASAPGGMSFTFMEPITSSDDDGDAQIAGDAAHYSDADLTRAATVLQRALANPVQPERLYQFNDVSTAMVVIGLTTNLLAALGPNLLASALWDACKLLWRPGSAPHERSRFTITTRESPRGRRRLKLVIDVPDQAALETALTRAPAVLQSAAEGTFDFKQQSGDFEPVEGSVSPSDAAPPELES